MSAVAVPLAERVRYTAPMRAVHWATALLLIGSYATAWTISGTTTNEDLQRLSLMHRSFGVEILGLTAVRFVVRRRSRVLPLPEDVPGLQRFAARLNVLALYALLFLQPLLGVVASMLHGDKIRLLGGVVVPDLLPVDRALAHSLFEAHGTVALLLLGLIGMHVLAALYHHFVRRDDVLATMLPGMHPSPPRRSLTPL
jgi:cytochrome b561